MDRETTNAIELIDLGVASVETKGGGSEIIELIELQPLPGIGDS